MFSCWNGAVAFTAKPLLEGEVSFRSPHEGECYQGEPQLLCKDMWHRGYGKIAVVPTVNLEYSDEKGKAIKNLKGYALDLIATVPDESKAGKIDWQPHPPAMVKCMAVMEKPDWRPWNETIL